MTVGTRWRTEARRLADELLARGSLSPGWRAAFEDVPRGQFIPRYYRHDNSVVDSADPADFEEWIAAVYSDQSLVTQLRPVPGTDVLLPTSSSTMPSLMARMLDLLDVRGGDRVLEIGTGTGYNAALLCHRLGDERVASVDIDTGLVDEARERLAGLGMAPTLAAGDGMRGLAEHAPYDRIIATCAVPLVPPDWIRQLAPDGIAVLDMRGELASALIVLRADGSEAARGRFLPFAGHFMWLRDSVPSPLRTRRSLIHYTTRIEGPIRPSTIDAAVFEDLDLRFFANLAVPGISSVSRRRSDRREMIYLRTDDGSWAAVDLERDELGNVTQGGDRNIWDELERAAAEWMRLGRPSRSRFGLIAHVDGRHEIWLDDSSSVRLSSVDAGNPQPPPAS